MNIKSPVFSFYPHALPAPSCFLYAFQCLAYRLLSLNFNFSDFHSIVNVAFLLHDQFTVNHFSVNILNSNFSKNVIFNSKEIHIHSLDFVFVSFCKGASFVPVY
jgi:hypothetical protein